VEEDEEQMDSLKMLLRLEEKWKDELNGLDNEKEKKVLRAKIGDLKRLQRVELIYVSLAAVLYEDVR
jgi:transcriptional regulator of heat shock response